MKIFNINSRSLNVFLCLIVLTIIGCKENLEQETIAPEINSSEIAVEEAYPETRGEVKKINGNCSIFCEYELINGEIVVEGDIILTKEQLEYLERSGDGATVEGAGLTDLAKRWPNNLVYYTISSFLPVSNQARVNQAIAHWSSNSNLRFAYVLNPELVDNYIEFVPSFGGCSSSLGMIGGRQVIRLGDSCTTGNTIHEIGHAIGVFHEHARADRDSYVDILWANIISGTEHNFETYVDRGIGGFDYGVFDFGSIMMYPSSAFSSNGLPTITKKDGSTFSAQRIGLSMIDIATAGYMYPGSKGQATSGTHSDLDYYSPLYNTSAPSNMEDIVAVAIAGSTDHCYTWYKDGTVSVGISSDLDRYQPKRSYSLAPGKFPSDVAGIAIAGSTDHCYVWYKDGTVSSGTSRDLDRYRSRYSYSLAPGMTPSNIIGMGIAGSNDHCYVLYDDGTASSGTSSNLDRYRSRYNYTLDPSKSIDEIVGMGIAGSNDHFYVWMK